MNKLMYQFREIGFPVEENFDQCLNIIPILGRNTCEDFRFAQCKLDEQLFIGEISGSFSTSDCQVNTTIVCVPYKKAT